MIIVNFKTKDELINEINKYLINVSHLIFNNGSAILLDFNDDNELIETCYYLGNGMNYVYEFYQFNSDFLDMENIRHYINKNFNIYDIDDIAGLDAHYVNSLKLNK